jgi:hypothetical protein
MNPRENIAPLNLDPDYQRAHVWTREQQIAYVEYMLQGGEVGRAITFNCPGWMGDWRGPFELVDGKQRLEAARTWMNDEFKTFGHYFSEFEEPRRLPDLNFDFRVCKLASREEVLRLYLNINAGGTPHTAEELERVRALLRKAEKK